MLNRTNNLLIGIIVSVLLSLFVNFSPGAAGLFPDKAALFMLYSRLLWFFLFSLALFILNTQGYRIGEKIFRRSEYKTLLCVIGCSLLAAFLLLRAYPALNTAFYTLLGKESYLPFHAPENTVMISCSLVSEQAPGGTTPGRQGDDRPERTGKSGGRTETAKNGSKESSAAKDAGQENRSPLANLPATAFTPDSAGQTGAPRYAAKDFVVRPLSPPLFPPLLMTEHLFILLVVVLTGMFMRLLSSKQKMQLEYERLKSEKWQTSYNALMGQINPHFFFNSLNGLNALIRAGNEEQTLTYLDELSAVFRYILQSNKKELVTLAEELEFVKAYTYLLQVRYEGKLFFSVQVEQTYLFWHLPILSILPLVENAVKHNVISRQYPLRIDLYTNADGCLVVSNPVRPKMEANAGSGIGLKNLWGRYQMLTGKDIVISRRKEYFKVLLPLLKTPLHP